MAKKRGIGRPRKGGGKTKPRVKHTKTSVANAQLRVGNFFSIQPLTLTLRTHSSLTSGKTRVHMNRQSLLLTLLSIATQVHSFPPIPLFASVNYCALTKLTEHQNRRGNPSPRHSFSLPQQTLPKKSLPHNQYIITWFPLLTAIKAADTLSVDYCYVFNIFF